MKSTERDQTGLGRRGLFAGMLAGLGAAALTLGGRKVRARGARAKAGTGEVLYRRSDEADRYLKTLF